MSRKFKNILKKGKYIHFSKKKDGFKNASKDESNDIIYFECKEAWTYVGKMSKTQEKMALKEK